MHSTRPTSSPISSLGDPLRRSSVSHLSPNVQGQTSRIETRPLLNLSLANLVEQQEQNQPTSGNQTVLWVPPTRPIRAAKATQSPMNVNVISSSNDVEFACESQLSTNTSGPSLPQQTVSFRQKLTLVL